MIDGSSIPASVMMKTVFALLICNPGSFVPNIQRCVNGIEAATKRFAECTNEDSFTTDQEIIMQLYASAMIAQNDRSWKPSLRSSVGMNLASMTFPLVLF